LELLFWLYTIYGFNVHSVFYLDRFNCFVIIFLLPNHYLCPQKMIKKSSFYIFIWNMSFHPILTLPSIWVCTCIILMNSLLVLAEQILNWKQSCTHSYFHITTWCIYRLSERTYSLWGYITKHMSEFLNPLYKKDYEHQQPVIRFCFYRILVHSVFYLDGFNVHSVFYLDRFNCFVIIFLLPNHYLCPQKMIKKKSFYIFIWNMSFHPILTLPSIWV
jgi:hypothetical protein